MSANDRRTSASENPADLPSAIVTRSAIYGAHPADQPASLLLVREAAPVGFTEMGRGRDPGKAFTFLGSDGTLVLTLWQQAAQGFDRDRAGLHHLAFRVENADAVHETETRVRAAGGTIHYDGILPHSEGAASGGIFDDPDGTRLEISGPITDVAAAAPSGTAPTCGFF